MKYCIGRIACGSVTSAWFGVVAIPSLKKPSSTSRLRGFPDRSRLRVPSALLSLAAPLLRSKPLIAEMSRNGADQFFNLAGSNEAVVWRRCLGNFEVY